MSGLLGAGYDSSDDDASAVPKPSVTAATQVVAAPEVNTEVWSPILIFPLR
jgi:pre-mRNA-processing factor 17